MYETQFFIRDNGTRIDLNDIKKVYTQIGESLLGSRRFYFLEVPGLLWNRKIELNQNEYARLLQASSRVRFMESVPVSILMQMEELWERKLRGDPVDCNEEFQKYVVEYKEHQKHVRAHIDSSKEWSITPD